MLVFAVLLVTNQLCYGKVGVHTTIGSMESVFGKRHLLESLGSQNLLSELIQHHRFHDEQVSDSVHRSHIACSSYANMNLLSTGLMSIEPKKSSVTYSSSSDDIACFHTMINRNQQQTLQQSEVPLKLLETVPSMLKMDTSVSSYQSLMSNPHFPPSSHPILSKVVEGKAVDLVVMFPRGSNKSKQESTRQSLLGSLHQPSESHINEVFESSFWLHELKAPRESKRSLKETDKSLLGDEERKKTARSEHKSRSFHEADADDGRAFHAQQKVEWTHYHTLLKEAFQSKGTNVADVCGFSKLTPEMHSNGFSLRLPQELLHTSSEASPMKSACFAYLVTTVSLHDEVVRIALTLPMHTMNNNARQIVQSGGKNGVEPFTAVGLNGTGVIIGVSDTGIDEDHCFFRDPVNGKVPRADVLDTVIDLKYRKVIQYVNFSGSHADFKDGHGSHVAGTLAGYCVTEGDQNAVKNTYMGMASGSKLAFFDIGVNDAAQDLELPYELSAYLFPPAYQAGARIHSNSWGGGYFFDGYCIEADKYLYENDDFVALFAAGNDGGSMETIVSPGLAKNVIAVGCTENAHTASQSISNVAYFSSIGPTHDGRIKPDIVAPGYSVYSTKSMDENSPAQTCDTEPKAGTSMATPVAAGHAALIRQYFEDPRFWARYCDPQYTSICKSFSPSGYLTKALMIHSADAMALYNAKYTSVGIVHLAQTPDPYQGYGRLDLANILPLGSSHYKLFFDQSTALPQLTQMSYTVTVTDATVPLRVTLSWYDPPNDVFAAKTLLHDLDLIVLDPSGSTFYGNGMSTGGTPAYGSHRDEVNNNEQVIVTAPTVGVWTVQVQAKRLTEAPTQKYAVVISCMGTFASAEAPEAISSLLIQDCANSGGTPYFTPRLEVDVSLWSRVDNNGWDSSDFYTVSSTDTPASTAPSTGAMSEYSYQLDSLCLPTGCYSASLSLSSLAHKGSQMSVAQCGVFLSATNPVDAFCVADPITLTNSTTQYYAEDACYDPCTVEDHFSLELLLGEEQGAGWNGAYYTIQKIPTGPDSSLTFTSQSVAGGSMEWDFEEYPTKCLPEAPACYALQLSIPAGTEDIPQMYIMNTYTDSSMSHICPYIMDASLTLAKFCTLPDNDHIQVQYYRQASPTDLGQTPSTSWSTFYTAVTTGLTLAGECAMHLPLQITATGDSAYPTLLPSPGVPVYAPTLPPNFLFPTSRPSDNTGIFRPDDDFDVGNKTDDEVPDIVRDDDKRPTLLPTPLPTYTSTSSVFGGSSYQCLRDCAGFSGSSFGSDWGQSCLFLAAIYDRCDSFSVAYGLCQVPSCASDCSVEDWCYFAAGTVTSCPYDGWQGATTAALEIQTQCVSSTNLANSINANGDDEDSGKAFKMSHTTLVIIILMSVVIGIIILYCLIQYACKSSGSNYSMAADQSTHHGGSFPRAGSGSGAAGGGTPSLLRSSGNFIKSIVDKTASSKNRRPSTGKKGAYEMVPGSGSVGKSPFTIAGDDDDEDLDVSRSGATESGHQEESGF